MLCRQPGAYTPQQLVSCCGNMALCSSLFLCLQTSSGKTHTMKGNEADPGIIPLAVREVFRLIGESPDREFLLRVSYMEVGRGLVIACSICIMAA